MEEKGLKGLDGFLPRSAGTVNAGSEAWVPEVTVDCRRPIKVLCVGHVTHDRVAGHLVPGGCAFYAARAVRALGADCSLATAVGEDFLFATELVGLQWHASRRGSTTLFMNTYPNSGPRVQYVEQVCESVLPSTLTSGWENEDVVFLGPVIDEVDLEAWKRSLRCRILAIGVQGFVRTPEVSRESLLAARRVVPKPWSPSARVLDGIDVACLSEEDLVGQADLLDRLIDSIPLVALTRERRGCDLFTEGRSSWVGIHPVRVANPTGAGDTFAAGLLYGLACGMTPVESARLGAAAASILIETDGNARFDRLPEAFERSSRIPP